MRSVPLVVRRRRPLLRARYLLLVLALVMLTPKLEPNQIPMLANWLPGAELEQSRRG